MRRTRKDATKVWHNPELNTFAKRGGGNGGVARASTESSAEDRRDAKQHRAALEALFAPKREPEPEDAAKKSGAGGPASKGGGRIVLTAPPQADARTGERQKLLNKLLIAEGRPSVSKAADAFVAAGFTFPEDQDVYLQLLEHGKEEHVRQAIAQLEALLAGELPKRRAVLESRLRRIEQFAEEPSTREAAERLRRCVSGRAVSPTVPPRPVSQ
jgi:hypothetical protein